MKVITSLHGNAKCLTVTVHEPEREHMLLGAGATAILRSAARALAHRYAHVAIQNTHGSATSARPTAGSQAGASCGGSRM